MQMALDIAAAACLILGAGFCALSGLGMARMPDLFCRLQASTKAGTLGVPLLAIGAIIHFASTTVGLRATLIIAFLFLTAPVSAHVIARAAHRAGVAMSKRATLDALRDDQPNQPDQPDQPASD